MQLFLRYTVKDYLRIGIHFLQEGINGSQVRKTSESFFLRPVKNKADLFPPYKPFRFIFPEFPFEKTTLINVDKNKKGKRDEIEGLAIELVPTIIFYKDEKEIGRIIETPKDTLEKDMLDILMGDENLNAKE